MCISISFDIICIYLFHPERCVSQRLTAWGRKQGTNYTNLSLILWHCNSGFPRKLPAQLFLHCGYLTKLLNAYCSCGHCAPTFSAFLGWLNIMDPMQGPCCAKSHHLSSVHHIPMTIEDFEVAIVPRKADGMRRAPYHIQSRHQKKCPAWKNIRFFTGDKRHWALLESGEGFPKKNVEQAKYASTWCLKSFQFLNGLV